jgi:hypothetical protein
MGKDFLAPVIVGALLSFACGEKHVVVRDATTSPERRFECHKAETGQAAPKCTPSTEDVPAADNASGTSVIAMPSECKGRINEVLVRNAGSSNPTVLVRCATAETKPDVLGPDGGT